MFAWGFFCFVLFSVNSPPPGSGTDARIPGLHAFIPQQLQIKRKYATDSWRQTAAGEGGAFGTFLRPRSSRRCQGSGPG